MINQEELHARWDRRFGVPLLAAWAPRRCGTSSSPIDWAGFARGSLGEVVPGFEIKVADEESREVPDGTIGHLWVRGGSRALGYWQQLEKSQTCGRRSSRPSCPTVWSRTSVREVIFLESLPTTQLGKVDRGRLRSNA
ncbi:MAG: AMP-binding protein [Gemmatimonadales bacterium]